MQDPTLNEARHKFALARCMEVLGSSEVLRWNGLQYTGVHNKLYVN